MLNHVQNVGVSRAPHEYCLHDDERKPVRLVPKAEKADDANADGCESQFHLETAIHRPADASGNLVSIDDMAEESAHDAEPA